MKNLNKERRVMLGMVSLSDVSDIKSDVEQHLYLIGKKSALALRFISFEDNFPTDMCNTLINNNITPVLNWLFYKPSVHWDNKRDCSPEETGLDNLLNGEFDSYIDKFALKAKEFNKDIFIQFFHAFNSSWYLWSGEKNGGNPNGVEKVKKSWIYVVKRFKNIGANNVKWIWSPHEPSVNISREKWNNIENYWPGDEFVDWLGIDGYNFYPENPERENPPLMYFDKLFDETYNELKLLSDKPICIITGSGEFSSDGKIKNKAQWITDSLESIKSRYSSVGMLFWFNYKFNEKSNWMLDSSRESLQAFRAGIISETFTSNYR